MSYGRAEDRGAERARFLSMSESALLALVQSASKSTLRKIYGLGLVCRCEPLKQYGMRMGLVGARCDDDGVPVRGFVPCPHTPTNVLPMVVCVIVRERLWPKEYREPPLDSAGSEAVSYQECLELRINRARRRRSLFHPGDVQKAGINGLADALGIKARRERNGDIVELGKVHLATLGNDQDDEQDRLDSINPEVLQRSGFALGWKTKGLMDDDD